MKKLILAVLLILPFSCAKDRYTCECTITNNATGKETISTFTIDEDRSTAGAICGSVVGDSGITVSNCHIQEYY